MYRENIYQKTSSLQYNSHMDQTISYLREYLRVFHETKDIFLRFRVGKKAKRAAADVHKTLLQEQTEVQASLQDLTNSEKARLRQENTLELRELVDEILKAGAHYNFLKIPLISHYMEQIPNFGVLGQYSTDISETIYKAFKDAYRRSNRVNSISQIVTTYTRDHTFTMKDLTIKTWTWVREEGELTGGVGKKAAQGQVYLKLRGKIELGVAGNLAELKGAMALGDVVLAIRVFLTRDVRCTYSDV